MQKNQGVRNPQEQNGRMFAANSLILLHIFETILVLYGHIRAEGYYPVLT
jgi:hypothetical protein